MGQTLTFAIDFDGCLTEYNFPDIGEQTEKQKQLMNLLKKLQSKGHKLILWTSRGEPALQEAIAKIETLETKVAALEGK